MLTLEQVEQWFDPKFQRELIVSLGGPVGFLEYYYHVARSRILPPLPLLLARAAMMSTGSLLYERGTAVPSAISVFSSVTGQYKLDAAAINAQSLTSARDWRAYTSLPNQTSAEIWTNVISNLATGAFGGYEGPVLENAPYFWASDSTFELVNEMSVGWGATFQEGTVTNPARFLNANAPVGARDANQNVGLPLQNDPGFTDKLRKIMASPVYLIELIPFKREGFSPPIAESNVSIHVGQAYSNNWMTSPANDDIMLSMGCMTKIGVNGEAPKILVFNQADPGRSFAAGVVTPTFSETLRTLDYATGATVWQTFAYLGGLMTQSFSGMITATPLLPGTAAFSDLVNFRPMVDR